jgi:hypothetical protein
MTRLLSLLPIAAEGELQSSVQIVAVVVTALLLLVVLELVRRRRLVERYALLWMSVAVALLVLAVWTDLLDWASDRVGIADPANALFLAAFGVAFVLLLHFSVANSRLGEETKILAQEVARLDERLRDLRAGSANGMPQERAAPDGAPSGSGERPVPSNRRTTDQ